MEVAVVFMGLAGLGYYLNGNEQETTSQIMMKDVRRPDLSAYKPSGPDPYENNRTLEVRMTEQKLSDDLYKKSENPWETSIVPPYMNEQPGALMPNPAMFAAKHEDSKPSPIIPSTEPFHNNMVPFFGGSVKQNMDMNQNSTLFEYHTGTNKIHTHKKESGPLFQPWENRNDFVNGYFEGGDRDTSRFVPSITQEGIKPFQPTQVGPGLNQGPTSKPSGGFQDLYRAPQKTVDDLRVNPKTTYDGRVVSGKSLISNRGQQTQLSKNRPETAWSQSQDNLFRTTGAVTGNTGRAKYIVKPTHRRCSMQYAGAAGPAVIEAQEARPMVQADRRHTFTTDGPRNANMPEGWTVKESQGDISDYGKNSIQNYDNERASTTCRTYQSNVKGVTDREIAPLEDTLRMTRKEDYVKYSRTGNVKIKGIKEFPVSNQQVPKPTIKETLIHDTRTGNFKRDAPSGLTVHDPQDTARTTIKETLIHDPHTGNMNAPKKSGSNSYDPAEWRFRSTLREKNPYSKWCTAPKPLITGPKRSTIPMIDKAKTTIKETTVSDTREGFLNSEVKKPTVHDPKDVPRVTVRETTVDQRRTGNVNAGLLQDGKGYETARYEARPVNRQYISTVEHFNNPERDMGQGYLTNPQQVKTTLKQMLTEYMQIGPAGTTAANAPMDDLQYCNQINNLEKEKIAKGRAPTLNSAKTAIGGDAVNMESKHLMPTDNDRDFAPQRTYQVVASPSICQDTKMTNKTSDVVPDNRLDPGLLKPFEKNPFTQSLHSY